MLDRLTDLDDHELDEQAALFLHSKNAKRTPSLQSAQPSQSKLLAINVKQNPNSDAESAANSYDDKGGSKSRIFSEPLLSEKRGIIKTKPSVNTLQPRELSIERVDASDNNMRGSLRSKKNPVQASPGSMSSKTRGKKKLRPALNNDERKPSALFPGNLGARMTVYVSDVGDESDEEFVYPKYRSQSRLANQKSGPLCDKLDRRSPINSPLFSPRTPVPSQSASPLVSDGEYFKSGEYERVGNSNKFYDSGSSIDSEGDDGYFSAKWKNGARGAKSQLNSPNHRHKSVTPGKEFSRRGQGYTSPSHQASRVQSDVDETLPLFWKMNPSEARRRRNRNQQKRNPLIGTLSLVFLGIVCCFIYAFSTIPLTDVSLTAVTNVLAAEKELVFDAHLKGKNWNIWAVEISTVDVGIFATPIKKNNTESRIARSSEDIINEVGSNLQEKRGTRPAEFLGNLDHLDEPIMFNRGNGISGTPNNVTAQFRLRNPGGVADEAENKWYQILRHPYELTFRGVLKYRLFFKSYAIRVCAIQGIDPTGDETKYEPLVVCDRENWDPRDFPEFRS
ncbi:Vacuolar inheritance and morphology protein [Basidiobolus ranarum]|uniref:Vacuolar inheritance and morphology protein n=1 Tax=Basidiobolus ranarum TaxID=34480 RepID=A0ABR2VV53_9FUNG